MKLITLQGKADLFNLDHMVNVQGYPDGTLDLFFVNNIGVKLSPQQSIWFELVINSITVSDVNNHLFDFLSFEQMIADVHICKPCRTDIANSPLLKKGGEKGMFYLCAQHKKQAGKLFGVEYFAIDMKLFDKVLIKPEAAETTESVEAIEPDAELVGAME